MADSLWSWCRDPGFFPITPLKSPILPISIRLSCTIPDPVFMESSGESLCKEEYKKIYKQQSINIALIYIGRVRLLKKLNGNKNVCYNKGECNFTIHEIVKLRARGKQRSSTYREVHTVELVDERFHPGFILFVDWFVHLKQQINHLQLLLLKHTLLSKPLYISSYLVRVFSYLR